MVKIRVKKLNPDAVVPEYAHEGDAGMDLFSCGSDYTLKPGERKLFETGISVELPEGYVGLVWDKSGVANKGVTTLAGVMDSGYRGEYKIILLNTSNTDYEIKKGQKIAQLLIQRVERAEVEEVKGDDLSKSQRGEGGFGSSGLNQKKS